MKILIITLSVLLFGCVREVETVTVKCSDDQLKMVEKQYNICSQTGYLDTICYRQARVEQCDSIEYIKD